jgi:hypothetical protein
MTYVEFENLAPGNMIRYVKRKDYDIVLSGPIKSMSDDGKTVTAYRLLVYCKTTGKIDKIRVLLNRWEVVYENK